MYNIRSTDNCCARFSIVSTTKVHDLILHILISLVGLGRIVNADVTYYARLETEYSVCLYGEPS